MIPTERREMILAMMEARRVVSVTRLSEELDVSSVTIRKDLQVLEDAGYVKRIHGGAVLVAEGRGYEPSVHVRSEERIQEKRRIAERAASLVESGDTIILDSGTTTGALAQLLKGRQDITVVTNAVDIAAMLAESGVPTVCIGGRVRPQTLSSFGYFTENSLRQLYVDKTFLAAGGVSAEQGITNAHLEEPPVKQAMIQAAQQVILLADHTKVGKVSLARVAPIDAANLLITNEEANPAHVAAIREAGVEVFLV